MATTTTHAAINYLLSLSSDCNYQLGVQSYEARKTENDPDYFDRFVLPSGDLKTNDVWADYIKFNQSAYLWS